METADKVELTPGTLVDAVGFLTTNSAERFFQETMFRRIGFVAHAQGLYPALSAAENLAFFCTLQGVDRARVAEVLDLVGLADVAGRPAGKLSRGAQQRLAIGRAVLHDPPLLVLDEPDASLDSDGPDLLVKVMRGRTAIIATHDHALANRLCKRTLELRRGRVVGVPTRLRVVH